MQAYTDKWEKHQRRTKITQYVKKEKIQSENSLSLRSPFSLHQRQKVAQLAFVSPNLATMQ